MKPARPAPLVPDPAVARVRLRLLGVPDAPGFHQACGDPEAMRFWDAPQAHDVGETEARIRRSLRLAGRLGFRQEGLLRDRLEVAGAPRSMWMYGLLAPEWHAGGTTDAQSVGAAP